MTSQQTEEAVPRPAGPDQPGRRPLAAPRLWLLAGGAAAVLAGAGAWVLFAGGDSDRTVTDGPLRMTVGEVKCGQGELVRDGSRRSPLGQYCTVRLTVENTGQQPARLPEVEQRAFDSTGLEYRPDLAAGLLAEPPAEHHTFTSLIKPGAKVSGTLAYDLAPKAGLHRLVLHASAGSAGAKVILKGEA